MSLVRRLSSIARSVAKLLGVYKLYEVMLEKELLRGGVPRHIGLILDGNRRWAMEKGLPKWVGHARGADKLEEALNWFLKLGVKTVTVYALSIDNLRRPGDEVSELLRLIRDKARKMLRNRVLYEKKVRVKVIGELELLPDDVREALLALEKSTEGHDNYFLNIAIAYDGRQEITRAAQRAARLVAEGVIKPDEINEDLLSRLMYTSFLPDPDPDLIIRTSGEVRLSGFLLWQCRYSELVFIDVYWPEFRYVDLLRAIRTYQKRVRRFGL